MSEEEPHQCHFCGTYVEDGVDAEGPRPRRRHWLSDCRPDLVEHEPGPLCTWAYRRTDGMSGEELLNTCYAWNNETYEHDTFYPDGPM